MCVYGVVQQSNDWGKIWHLCISHKIEVLLWRLCRNNDPVRIRLRGKGIHVPIGCVMCVEDVEHLMHLFFDYGISKDCWQQMGLVYDTWEVESVPDWLLSKLDTEKSEVLIKIVTVLWGIW